MLVACRLAGLSALEAHYAGVRVGAQFGPTQRSRRPSADAAMTFSGSVVQGRLAPVIEARHSIRARAG